MSTIQKNTPSTYIAPSTTSNNPGGGTTVAPETTEKAPTESFLGSNSKTVFSLALMNSLNELKLKEAVSADAPVAEGKMAKSMLWDIARLTPKEPPAAAKPERTPEQEARIQRGLEGIKNNASLTDEQKMRETVRFMFVVHSREHQPVMKPPTQGGGFGGPIK